MEKYYYNFGIGMFGRNKKKRINLPLRSQSEPVTHRPDLMKRLSNQGNRIRRMLFRVLAVVALAFLIYAFIGGSNGLIHIAKLHAKKNELVHTNHQLLARLINADIIKNRLENDRTYIEFIARTMHNFTRPNEVIYRFKE